MFGRLHELAHHRPVLASDERDRKAAPFDDQAVGDRRVLDRDGDLFRLERHLHGPVQGHQVPALAGAAPENVQARRQPPEHTAAQSFVLWRAEVARERTVGDRVGAHGRTVAVPAG